MHCGNILEQKHEQDIVPGREKMVVPRGGGYMQLTIAVRTRYECAVSDVRHGLGAMGCSHVARACRYPPCPVEQVRVGKV